jgi:hypothetical protein
MVEEKRMGGKNPRTRLINYSYAVLRFISNQSNTSTNGPSPPSPSSTCTIKSDVKGNVLVLPFTYVTAYVYSGTFDHPLTCKWRRHNTSATSSLGIWAFLVFGLGFGVLGCMKIK